MESLLASFPKTSFVLPPPPLKHPGFGSTRFLRPNLMKPRIHIEPPLAPLKAHKHEHTSKQEEEEKILHEDAEHLVEELELLVEEAIAGKDDGREPSDYDRRARIFYESSRVFQELKEKERRGGVGLVSDDGTDADRLQRGPVD